MTGPRELPEDLCYLPATTACELFARRELSPVEFVEAVIARAEATEPLLNSLCIRYFDEALARAKRAEASYAGTGRRPRPLEGIPVAVKEETAVAGQVMASASLAHAGERASVTAVVVERVLRAGAIVHARSTAPEFSCAPFTHSRLWGVTRNPWNLAYDPGGSSGGAAASLAAGSSTLATGSDIGGSIRIPASACGVVGFKPPYGRVPEAPPYNLDHYCHEGPLARTVADCALFENVLAGPHPSDAASLRPKLSVPVRPGGFGEGSLQGWRVALSVTLGDFEVDQDVARNTLEAAEALAEAGAVVEQVELPWRRAELFDAARIHFGSIMGPLLQREARLHREEMTAYALEFADRMTLSSGEEYLRGLEIETRAQAALAGVLKSHRILLCPTLAYPALDAGDDYVSRGPTINGVPQASTWDGVMTYPFNICSRNPVLAVPSGFARTGVPTGVQIVGRAYDDASVFRAGAALETVRPWLDCAERRPDL